MFKQVRGVDRWAPNTSPLKYSHRPPARLPACFNIIPLDREKDVLGVDHSDTLISTCNLASALRGQGKFVRPL